jgi:hypothetical protein
MAPVAQQAGQRGHGVGRHLRVDGGKLGQQLGIAGLERGYHAQLHQRLYATGTVAVGHEVHNLLVCEKRQAFQVLARAAVEVELVGVQVAQLS